MDLKLKDKVVVITGGAGGLGRSMVRAFTDEGARVAICGRNENKLERFKKEFSLTSDESNLICCTADVSKEEDIETFIKKTVECFGNIDILINNAGVEHFSELSQIEESQWDMVMDVNLKGIMMFCKQTIPHMRSDGASIINISSFTSLVPTARNGVYSISKAAVNSLTKVLAAELAPKKIRVNGIIPGMIITEMNTDVIDNIEDKLIEPISLNRLGRPDEIAMGALYLASPQMSSYVNGHSLVISGGKFLVQNPADPWNDYIGGY